MRVSSDNSNEPKKKKSTHQKKKSPKKKLTIIKPKDIHEQIEESQPMQTPPAPWKGMSKGRQAKNDYDSDDFYDEAFFLAFNGASDAEIANAFDITPTYFSLIKNGKVVEWSKEDNARRSARLLKVLERARKKIMQAIKGKYLAAALGGQEVESISTTTRMVRLSGQDAPAEVIQETRTKTKTLPNMQALATLMFHYDKEWRKVQRGLDEETQDVPTNIETGIDIEKWIEREVGINLKD
ncbi:MAG: hypothetical protein ACI30J_08980 [Paludibacteraceae bacterium]